MTLAHYNFWYQRNAAKSGTANAQLDIVTLRHQRDHMIISRSAQAVFPIPPLPLSSLLSHARSPIITYITSRHSYVLSSPIEDIAPPVTELLTWSQTNLE